MLLPFRFGEGGWEGEVHRTHVVLDSARFETFIALELRVLPADVKAMVLGSHGDLMVPLSGYATVNGIPITELLDAATIERLVERTRNGGAEIVELMQTGGAFFAPASATSVMVESILLNQSRLLPVAAYLQGEYGLKDVVIGVPCRLGCGGIESILELTLTDEEKECLHTSAQSVRQNIERSQEIICNTSLRETAQLLETLRVACFPVRAAVGKGYDYALLPRQRLRPTLGEAAPTTTR